MQEGVGQRDGLRITQNIRGSSRACFASAVRRGGGPAIGVGETACTAAGGSPRCRAAYRCPYAANGRSGCAGTGIRTLRTPHTVDQHGVNAHLCYFNMKPVLHAVTMNTASICSTARLTAAAIAMKLRPTAAAKESGEFGRVLTGATVVIGMSAFTAAGAAISTSRERCWFGSAKARAQILAADFVSARARVRGSRFCTILSKFIKFHCFKLETVGF